MEPVNHGTRPPAQKPAGIGGWLLVLCALLLVWHPLNLAFVASNAVSAISFYGLPLTLVLGARLLVTALGIAAGLALVRRRIGAVTLAKASLVASGVTDVFVYTTRYFPRNRVPGDTPWYVAALVAYYAVWIAYLVRSKRVRNTFG